MKHIRVLTRQRPAQAQLEPLLQLVGLLSSLLSLFGQASDLLTRLAEKEDGGDAP